jgi:lichenan operon transcriptional antiterminator
LLRRHREILSFIFNTEGFLTGNELAKICGVSVRTIQLDIKEINNLLREYGTKINSVVKKGYYLEEKSKEILKEKNIIRSVLDYEYINETPITPFERQMYIILRLTVKDYIFVEELEEKLYVSMSTINKDIISAAAWLKENLDLKIDYSLSKRAELKVSEKEKRDIISWILSYKLNVSTLEKQWKYIFEGKEFFEDFGKMYPIAENETKLQGYCLSGHSLQLLCIEIMVASIRSTMGYKLEENYDKKVELKPIIIALSKRLEENMNVSLSQNEWLNLQEYFMSKQFASGTSIEKIETMESKQVVNEFLIVLNNKYKLDLAVYPEIKEKLILYVAPMINRLKHRHCIGNKISENINYIHPLEFKMASEISDIVKNKLNLSVNSVEVAYIAVHLAAAHKIWSEKLNTIIVCDYDESIISFIKDRIVAGLEDKIKLSGCFTFWQFILGEKEDFKAVDFIITTSTLADKTNISFIQISPLMEQKDISNLYEYIEHLSKK